MLCFALWKGYNQKLAKDWHRFYQNNQLWESSSLYIYLLYISSFAHYSFIISLWSTMQVGRDDPLSFIKKKTIGGFQTNLILKKFMLSYVEAFACNFEKDFEINESKPLVRFSSKFRYMFFSILLLNHFVIIIRCNIYILISRLV